jgi:hypothetical protein
MQTPLIFRGWPLMWKPVWASKRMVRKPIWVRRLSSSVPSAPSSRVSSV